MITELPDFVSVNQLSDVPPGQYLVVESFYARSDKAVSGLLRELISAENNRTVAADLQFAMEDGLLRFRDFALCADGTWRDSYGARGNALADLLPPDFLRYTLVKRRAIRVQHDGRADLVQIRDEGNSYGS